MGCDVHMYVEKKNNTKRPNMENGKIFAPVHVFKPWVAVKGINQWDIDMYNRRLEKDNENEHYVKMLEEAKKGCYADWVYDGRNYALFAMLAGVRNRCDFVQISDTKGVPSNMSDTVKNEYEEWYGDAHSASWLTLRELKEFNWNQTTKHQGYIPLSSYADYIKTGSPDSYSQVVSGGLVKHIGLSEANEWLKGKFEIDNKFSYYVHVNWTEKYSDSAEFFLDNSIPKLEELSKDNIGEDVRIVFWFDN